ncbi:MAG: MipA/OmpV family protein [Hyphomonadaceae bacterium]|nr:MipA/OmpV family protein [Hyphomonadaceae bacterium]
MTSSKLALTAIVVGAAIHMGPPAHAQDNVQLPGYQKDVESREGGDDWAIVVGAGAAYGPKFVGAEDSETVAFPYLSITYRNRFFLDARQGLGFFAINNEDGVAGIAVGAGPARDSKDDRRLFDGVDDIDSGAALRVFGSKTLGVVEASGAVTRTSGDVEGTTLDLGLGTGLPLGETTFVGLSVGATWADEDYLNGLFGVTAAQAQRRATQRLTQPNLTPLRAFEPESGFHQASVELSFTHVMAEKWVLTASVGYSQLLGDAADSPFVREVGAPSGALVLLRSF